MEKRRRFIFLNGPPGSGKDFVGKAIKHRCGGEAGGFKTVSFAAILKHRTHHLFGVPFSYEYAIDKWGEEWKNQPNVLFGNRTPREAYIFVSESVLKPFLGEQVFGKLMRQQLEQSMDPQITYLATDSGFVEEAVPIIHFVGINNCVVVHMRRHNKTFDGDSRNYWTYPGLRVFEFRNEFDRDDDPLLFTANLNNLIDRLTVVGR